MAKNWKKGSRPKRDLYQEITNWVLEQFEEDTPKWRKPWTPSEFPCSIPFNASSAKAYRGMNNMMLQMTALDHADPRFMTYKQAQAAGLQVKKGEHGSTVLFYKTVDKTKTNEKGEEEDASFLVARAYTVFNASQIEGMPELPAREKTWDDNEIADLFVSHMVETFDTEVKYGTDKACYFSGTNKVRMPNKGDFEDPGEYYATMFHEMVHRTAPLTGRDELKLSYEMEELVAELGSMFLSRQLNMPFNPNVDNNSATYIKGWALKGAIEGDKNFVFKASKMAQEAVEHVLTPEFREKINQIQKSDEAMQAAVTQVSGKSDVEINPESLDRIKSEVKQEAASSPAMSQ